MNYTWPTKPLDHRKGDKIYSTFGEFRGQAGDTGLARVHSGVDLNESGSNVKIYSPGTGLVSRFGGPAATGPVRIGHWGFNHISTIHAKAGQTINGVDIVDRIYVIDASEHYYVARAPNPSNDLHYERRHVGTTTSPFRGYRRDDIGAYREVTFWPKERAIGEGISSTSDLHVIYYTSDDGPYVDRANFANPLKGFVNYFNDEEPVAKHLIMSAQQTDEDLINISTSSGSVLVRPEHGGVNLKVFAYTELRGVCGIYQLEYMICPSDITAGELDPSMSNCTGIVNMWKFDRLPADDDCFVWPHDPPLSGIIDPRKSVFTNIENKRTCYVFTKSRNGDIDRTHHWEIEDPNAWPDGDYTISVWVKNIRQSHGADADPSVNEASYSAEVRISTEANGRMVDVRRRFRPT